MRDIIAKLTLYPYIREMGINITITITGII